MFITKESNFYNFREFVVFTYPSLRYVVLNRNFLNADRQFDLVGVILSISLGYPYYVIVPKCSAVRIWWEA